NSRKPGKDLYVRSLAPSRCPGGEIQLSETLTKGLVMTSRKKAPRRVGMVLEALEGRALLSAVRVAHHAAGLTHRAAGVQAAEVQAEFLGPKGFHPNGRISGTWVETDGMVTDLNGPNTTVSGSGTAHGLPGTVTLTGGKQRTEFAGPGIVVVGG